MTLSEWCAANLEGGFSVLHTKWKDATLRRPPLRRHRKVFLSVVLPSSGETKSLCARRLGRGRSTELGVNWTVAIVPDEGYGQKVM